MLQYKGEMDVQKLDPDEAPPLYSQETGGQPRGLVVLQAVKARRRSARLASLEEPCVDDAEPREEHRHTEQYTTFWNLSPIRAAFAAAKTYSLHRPSAFPSPDLPSLSSPVDLHERFCRTRRGPSSSERH